jgi:hypothetical protein
VSGGAHSQQKYKAGIMRGRAPFLVLALLGVLTTCGPICAQDKPAPDGTAFQTESPFAEEIKQLEAAADKAARVVLFEAILKKAAELKRDPEPLTSTLLNKKPEATFKELLEFLRDTPSARHAAFVNPLILAANDPGDPAKIAVAAVQAYDNAVPNVIAMLGSDVAAERLAAAAISCHRIGGAAGVGKLVPKLVAALDRNEPDLTGTVIKSLRRITLLDHEKPEQWKQWLGKKTELELSNEIADREHEARRKAEAERISAESKLLAITLERMRKDERNDATALISRLNPSEYLPVRLEAVKLLRDVLKTAKEDVAKTIIDALGAKLQDSAEVEDVRKQCAIALAECGKPELVFPHIDATLEANGLSADLKLELVKGLNAPIAAERLASLLKSEIDVVETRSGAVLETLISQVRGVVAEKDESAHKAAILAEFCRLLDLITAKLNGELEAPARKRYVDLAVKTSDTLVYIARQKSVDVSTCVDSLLNISLTQNGAASAALTALREALDVDSSRAALLAKLTTPPESDRLGALYAKMMATGDDPMLIKLIGLYEGMAFAPEPVADLRKRLTDRAASTEAQNPTSADSRKTLREAMRALLSVLLTKQEEHVALLTDLLEAEYGGNDALGYLMVLKSDRVAIMTTAMQPMVDRKPIKLAQLVIKLDQSLTQVERDNNDYKAFRSGLNSAVRGALADKISAALAAPLGEEAKKELTALATGALRDQFVPTAAAELAKKPAQTAERDTVSEILLSSLRQAHPDKYEKVELKGLSQADFVKALDDLNARLRNDGYAVP